MSLSDEEKPMKLEDEEEEEEVDEEEVVEEVEVYEEEPAEEEEEEESKQKTEGEARNVDDDKRQTPGGDEVTTSADHSAVLKSLSGLVDLSGTLSEFVRQWQALQHDLDYILSSIDRRSKELDAPGEVEKRGSSAAEPSAAGSQTSKVVDRATELVSICDSTSGRALRKFVITQLSELAWLRCEVPTALCRAPNPAKIVLDSLGRFYLQGRKAYDRPSDDPMVVFRRACMLILEFYVSSGCSSAQLDESIKKDAQVAAVSWRSRLINEGGLQAASAVDALGLVLFLASFGVPQEFGSRDVYTLLRLSNLKKKADVFRKSSILLQKMPDVVNDLLSKDVNVEAVELICAFELKERYPPLPLLVAFLQKFTQSTKDERKEGQFSLRSQREANEKQLEKLKLVVKCLEDYKLNPFELASFNIHEKISKLQKEIAIDEERLKNKNLKRKAQEMIQKNYWHPSAKPSLGVSPHFVKQFSEQQSATLSNSRSYYGNLYQRSMVDDELGMHNGTGLSSMTASAHTSAGGGAEVVATTAVVAATAEGGSGLTLGSSSHQFTNYGGGYYGLHGNGSQDERSLGQNLVPPAHSEAWMAPSQAAAQNAFYPQPPGTAYGTTNSTASLYQFGDAVLDREAYYSNTSISNNPNPTPSIPNQNFYPSFIS